MTRSHPFFVLISLDHFILVCLFACALRYTRRYFRMYSTYLDAPDVMRILRLEILRKLWHWNLRKEKRHDTPHSNWFYLEVLATISGSYTASRFQISKANNFVQTSTHPNYSNCTHRCVLVPKRRNYIPFITFIQHNHRWFDLAFFTYNVQKKKNIRVCLKKVNIQL